MEGYTAESDQTRFATALLSGLIKILDKYEQKNGLILFQYDENGEHYVISINFGLYC